MDLQISYTVKKFEELSIEELYACLQLRSEVFVVEQNCPYLDIDGKDQESYHLFLYVEGDLAGYTRILPAGLSFSEVAIGRVVTSPRFRGKGLGSILMQASINASIDLFGACAIRIGAQYHLSKFYQSLGFEEDGLPYDEDGIPHIEMIRHYSPSQR